MFLLFFDICQLKQAISFQCSRANKIWVCEIFETLNSVFIKHHNFRVETAKLSSFMLVKEFISVSICSSTDGKNSKISVKAKPQAQCGCAYSTA